MKLQIQAMRTRLYEILDVAQKGDLLSYIYDCIIALFVILSLIPLAFKSAPPSFVVMDRIAAIFFGIDYLLRLSVADKKMHGKIYDFFLYPFTPMAIIDLVSILPSFTPLTGGYRLLRIARMLRAVRVVRILKMLRYSKNIQHLTNVFRHERIALISVFTFVTVYILIVAMIMLNIEPQTFGNYLDAIYWSAMSLTTIGYGDLVPVTDIGRIITVFSSLIGILVVALPTGIITAGIMAELEKSRGERIEAEKSLDKFLGKPVDTQNRDELFYAMLRKMEELQVWEKDLSKREFEMEKEKEKHRIPPDESD